MYEPTEPGIADSIEILVAAGKFVNRFPDLFSLHCSLNEQNPSPITFPMALHTTNYYSTFIQVSEDSTAHKGEIPPFFRGKPTVARLQYELLSDYPYEFTSDDLLFRVHAERHRIPEEEWEEEREQFFSKGQPCLRTSPLAKKFGWGIHFNAEGKMALAGVETKRYTTFSRQQDLSIVKAVRSSRKD